MKSLLKAFGKAGARQEKIDKQWEKDEVLSARARAGARKRKFTMYYRKELQKSFCPETWIKILRDAKWEGSILIKDGVKITVSYGDHDIKSVFMELTRHRDISCYISEGNINDNRFGKALLQLKKELDKKEKGKKNKKHNPR